MDTPTPDPADSGSGTWRVDTVAAQVKAIDALLALARQHVQLFDIDLAQGGWQTAARVDALTRFLRQRNARFDVIVHETRWIESSAPRFVRLLRQYGHAMTLYRTGAEAKAAMDPLLIVDQRHFVHRFHIDRPRASVAMDLPLAAKPLCARFEEIWATGEPGLAGTVLGL